MESVPAEQKTMEEHRAILQHVEKTIRDETTTGLAEKMKIGSLSEASTAASSASGSN